MIDQGSFCRKMMTAGQSTFFHADALLFIVSLVFVINHHLYKIVSSLGPTTASSDNIIDNVRHVSDGVRREISVTFLSQITGKLGRKDYRSSEISRRTFAEGKHSTYGTPTEIDSWSWSWRISSADEQIHSDHSQSNSFQCQTDRRRYCPRCIDHWV